MKNIFFASTLFLLTVSFYSCKSNPGEPKVIAQKFFIALSKNDMATAKDLSTAESQPVLGLLEKQMQNNRGMMAKYDSSKISFGEAVIEGDNAHVPMKADSISIEVPLKKAGGEWKVDFTMSSLMNSNMDQMKQRRGLRGLERLKNMNVDSLAKEMLRKSDSAKAEMEKLK